MFLNRQNFWFYEEKLDFSIRKKNNPCIMAIEHTPASKRSLQTSAGAKGKKTGHTVLTAHAMLTGIGTHLLYLLQIPVIYVIIKIIHANCKTRRLRVSTKNCYSSK